MGRQAVLGAGDGDGGRGGQCGEGGRRIAGQVQLVHDASVDDEAFRDAAHEGEVGHIPEERRIAAPGAEQVGRGARDEDRYLSRRGGADAREESCGRRVGVFGGICAAIDGNVESPFGAQAPGVAVDGADVRVAEAGAKGLHRTALRIPQKVQKGEPVVDVAAAHAHGVVAIEDDSLHDGSSSPVVRRLGPPPFQSHL